MRVCFHFTSVILDIFLWLIFLRQLGDRISYQSTAKHPQIYQLIPIYVLLTFVLKEEFLGH